MYKNLIETQYFNSFAIEILVHNSNMKTTLFYSQLIVDESFGGYSKQAIVSGIFPEFYEYFGPDSTLIIILGVIYMLLFMVQIYQLFQRLSNSIRTL